VKPLSGPHLDRLVAALVALELLVIVGASSAERIVLRTDLRLRWLLLGALVLTTGALLARERTTPRRLVLPVTLGGAFVVLALLSGAWSAAASMTLPRALAIALLFFVVVGIAFAMRNQPERLAVQLEGIVGGAVLVALAGLVMLAVDRTAAIEPAQVSYPARFRGFGGNPDTAALLFAIALPIALAFALRSGPRRWLHAAACALLIGSVAPSGSRGALLGAILGALVVILLVKWTWRRRWIATALVVIVALGAVGVSELPQPVPSGQHARAKRVFDQNAEKGLPLDSEPGYGRPTKVFVRSLTTSSGRITAWRGAIRQAGDRIVLGYGFGTEKKVFVDRYPIFYSQRVEDAYLGTLLELGLGGLALLLALFASIAAPIPRAARIVADRTALAGAAGAFAAGLVLATVQSFPFSVGGTGALAFWLAAAVLVALAAGSAPTGAGQAQN
jgi:O-antigen ligase